MSLNTTPSADRLHIGIFGRRNAGKSSLINAITGQDLAVVSEVRGTTTDPVFKAMELLPLGPILLIDTPGLDDEGALGEQRIKKSLKVLHKTDVALIVLDGKQPFAEQDQMLIDQCKNMRIPYCVVINKADLIGNDFSKTFLHGMDFVCVSAKTGKGIDKLKQWIVYAAPKDSDQRKLVSDLVRPHDVAVLVVPIDSAAPKGRLILPQQKVIRDLLDAHATAVVCKESELKATLQMFGKPPRMVITDSQAFSEVASVTPLSIPLTSFSILLARQSSVLESSVAGVNQVKRLKEQDRILICEGCTHHRQCEDIGSVKIPRWLEKYTGHTFQYDFTSGGDFPEDLSAYRLVIHCGGCMLPNREILWRMRQAHQQQVPIVNYGILIAYLKGILPRSLELFPKVFDMLEE